jgi:ribosomal protein L3
LKALITRKVGMTSAINEDGGVQAITLLSVGEHTVLQHKTEEKDGYTAVQVGTESAKKLPKSLAGSMYPQHIFKGSKMAGQLGHDQITIKNLKVALVDPELGVIGVTGAVPGPRKGILLVKEAK